MKAIQNESPMQILVSFVEKGANVNIKADGKSNCSCPASSLSFVSVGPYQCSTALQLGSSQGDKEFVAVLLAHGADPNIRGEKMFQFRQGGT
jgi:ankyrin repeat protein